MFQDLIRYDLLVQEAMRKVIGKVLADIAKDGLPGDHHFYITFKTNSPGVKLSTRMREKYPEEMTIALQHQFWDLIVTDTYFEVGLSFSGISEKLHIPLNAVTVFYDPSVQFALTFQPYERTVEDEAETAEISSSTEGPIMLHPERSLIPEKNMRNALKSVPPKSKDRKSDIKKDAAGILDETVKKSTTKKKTVSADKTKSETEKTKKLPRPKETSDNSADVKEKLPSSRETKKKSSEKSAEIVSLDAFRKKT